MSNNNISPQIFNPQDIDRFNQSKLVKLKVASVKYSGREFNGFQYPNGTYGIGIPQIIDLLAEDKDGFCPSKNTASRDFKRLCGNGFRPSKHSTELGNAKVNVITLDDFGDLLTSSHR